MAEAGNRIGEKEDHSNEFRAHRLWNLAFHQFRLGQLRDAYANFGESVNLFVQTEDRFREKNVRIHYGMVLGVLGRYEEAMQQFDAAHTGSTNQSRRAQVCIMAGRIEEAIALANEARMSLRGATSQRDVLRADWIYAAAIISAAKGGERDIASWREAEELLHASLRTARVTGLQEYEVQILTALAEGELQQNQIDSARDFAEEARGIAERSGYRLWQADAHAVLSQVATMRNEQFKSREQASQARACALCDGLPFAYSSTLSLASELLDS